MHIDFSEEELKAVCKANEKVVEVRRTAAGNKQADWVEEKPFTQHEISWEDAVKHQASWRDGIRERLDDNFN